MRRCFRHSLLVKLLLLVGLLFKASLAFADDSKDIPIPDIHVSTPVYIPADGFLADTGVYNYTVSWQGIPAASATIEVSREDDYYRLVASAKTLKVIDVFYKMRYRAEGLVNSDDMKPVRSIVNHQENSKIKNTQISFKSSGEIFSVRSKVGEDPKVLRFDPQNFTLDPLSASFLARSLDWSVGDSRRFDTFDGKSRYLITLTCNEKKTIRFNNVDREVWVISPKVINLAKQEPNKKLREAHIYVTADDKREILKIDSEVFIGTVTTELQSYVPENPAPIRIAKAKLAANL